MNAEQCDAVSSDGLKFLRICAKLAVAEFVRGKPRQFPLYPKPHTFHEIMLECVRMDSRSRWRSTRLAMHAKWMRMLWAVRQGCPVELISRGSWAELSTGT